MDREAIRRDLSEAEQQVDLGELLVRRQREILERLSMDRYDTREARAILHTLEDAQALHIADRDRLRTDMENA